MWNVGESIFLAYRSYIEKTDCTESTEFLVEGNRIAFRGTNCDKNRLIPLAKDIITNANVIPKSTTATGSVPRGFYTAACEVLPILEKYLDNKDALYLTGHSSGGAIALIVGAMLKAKGYDIRSIHCFGSPRTGKLDILEYVDIQLYRNGEDVVTEVPWFYDHPRPLINIGHPDNPVYDHYINAYIKTFKKIFKIE